MFIVQTLQALKKFGQNIPIKILALLSLPPICEREKVFNGIIK